MKKGKKGGKFIAKGTSGCVVTPNYRCEPADEVSQDKVSKIFRTEDSFKTEIKESNVFKTIDPTGKYFFKIHQSCEFNADLNKKQIELENDLLNCDGSKYMYIANNAGIDLTKPDFKSKEEFDKVLINILEGLMLLKKNKLAHRDIKPANLSVALNPDGSKKGMILDYGLVTSISNKAFKNTDKWYKYANLLFEGSPQYMPHENNFITGFIKSQETIRPEFLPGRKFTAKKTNQFFKKNDIDILTSLSNKDKFKQFIDSSDNEYGYGTYIFETLTKKYNKLIQDGNIDRIQYLKNYIFNLDKIDVYALGVSLLEIIKKNRKQIIQNWATDFYDMIDKMIEPDINKRWNAEQILNHPYFEKKINNLVNNYKKFTKKMANNSLNQYIQNSEPIQKKTKKIKRSPINLGFERGEPIKAGKKVRKHRGITQTGGNKGRLRKGYRYSGKKLKSGLPQIIKCKSKRC